MGEIASWIVLSFAESWGLALTMQSLLNVIHRGLECIHYSGQCSNSCWPPSPVRRIEPRGHRDGCVSRKSIERPITWYYRDEREKWMDGIKKKKGRTCFCFWAFFFYIQQLPPSFFRVCWCSTGRGLSGSVLCLELRWDDDKRTRTSQLYRLCSTTTSKRLFTSPCNRTLHAER